MKKAIERKTYVIDASGKILGRLSTLIANILRGKNKTSFVPNADLGDNVVVINARNIRLTGNKLEQKKYYHHEPRRPGALKTETAGELMKKNPGKIIHMSVYRMLPKNKLQDVFIKKLTIFNDDSYLIKSNDIKLEEI